VADEFLNVVGIPPTDAESAIEQPLYLEGGGSVAVTAGSHAELAI
jgi:hypothetical protein